MARFCPFMIINVLALLAQPPCFYNPVWLHTIDDTIDVGLYSSPYAYDWNADGLKDLIVGQFQSGHIRFYENIGQNNNPVFDAPVYLTADGSIITLPYT